LAAQDLLHDGRFLDDIKTSRRYHSSMAVGLQAGEIFMPNRSWTTPAS